MGDALKAIIAALLGRAIAGDTGMQIAGVATVIGHNWPVFYHFKGGKGIACSLGFIIVSSPWIALALVAEQVVITAITRYMSVASIVSGVLYPTLTAIFHPHNTGLIIASSLIGALAIFSHRGNIARLIHGTENRLDFKKIKTISQKTMAKLKNRHK